MFSNHTIHCVRKNDTKCRIQLTYVSESVKDVLQGVEISLSPPNKMKSREQIEGDLIQMSARLHDLALRGAGAENLTEMGILTDAITKSMAEASNYALRIVKLHG